MSHIQYTDNLTFIPKIIGGSSAGTATYSVQSGFYQVIGNMISIQGNLSWTGHTGTGNMLIGNLPFAVKNVLNYDPEFIVRTDSILWPAAVGYIFGEFQTGQNTGQVVQCRDNSTEQLVQMSAAGTVHFTGTYLKNG